MAAPDDEQHCAHVPACEQRLPALQYPWDDKVVRHHDRQCDRFHDHHRGGGGEAANKSHQRDEFGAAGEGQREHEHVAIHASGWKAQNTGDSDRQDKEIDQYEIDRKQPRRARDLGLVVVLHHCDMELPWQQDDGEGREQSHCQQSAEAGFAAQDFHGGWCFHRLFEQRARPVEHIEGDEDADGEERHQFDDGFRRHGKHQAMLMFGGVDMPRAEQDGENRHRNGHDEREIAWHDLHYPRRFDAGMRQDGAQR